MTEKRRYNEKRNPRLWNDSVFIRTVTRIAAERGIRVGDACAAAGLSKDILNHPAKSNGRSIELILQLAKALDTDPAVLMSLPPTEQAGRPKPTPGWALIAAVLEAGTNPDSVSG